jgi:hypothetical protein
MEKFNTIFCDIDGSVFKYRKFENYTQEEAEVLPQAREKLSEWKQVGHMIVLTTARPEYLREHTIKELKKNKVPYDRLIMEIERGPRFLINDMDPDKPGERATGINLIRNQGFVNEDWQSLSL